MTHVEGAGVDVAVLERREPLATDLVVRAKIGRDGGTVRIREAGLYVSFPVGAVAAQTEITLVARAGKAVIFDFGPSPPSLSTRREKRSG